MRKLTKTDLLARVRKDAETKCWNYTGYIDKTGYGIFASARGSSNQAMPGRAHWFSYEAFVGPRQPGMHIHHLCENKRCVNPDHLVQLDPAAHSREHYGDQCPKGHGAEWWRIRANGSRYCRECDRLRVAAARAARSVPCEACGKPRLAHKDVGPRSRNFSGLCAACWRDAVRSPASIVRHVA